jgi:hypothetical protein
MVHSTEIIKKVQQALSAEDWKIVESSLTEIHQEKGKRAQKTLIKEINRLIITTAFKKNKPELLLALPDLPNNDIDDLFSQIVQQFIITRDEKWLESVYVLSDRLIKKSHQSRVIAMMAQALISAGVHESNAGFIDHGIILLERISFQKYRSDIMIDIIPLLIEWAITTRDEKLLYRSQHIIEEISDISKRAVLHAELAKALATVAILEKNRALFLDSIYSATGIHQKIRRQSSITCIIEKGVKSVFGKEILDISLFIQNFEALPHEIQLEIVNALTEQLLDREKDKTRIISILQVLSEKIPFVTHTIIIDLLKKAELSGELWYLSTAIELHQLFLNSEAYPLRELVRAGISVARQTNNMNVLLDLVAIIDKHSNTVVVSRIYLQFSQIMLSSGDFASALVIFRKISQETESLPQYEENLTLLLKTGILRHSIPLINDTILKRLNADIVNKSIYRAIIELSTDAPFNEIISHIHSITDLILLHPLQDHLLLESITILINRGFLSLHDPYILIRMTESIKDYPLKEEAVSNIALQIAKIGVKIKNRDYLQRAVGLTCDINGQDIRSVALSGIIDEASIFAAQQGDLDLLLRMREWINSLLEKNLAENAMVNIIDGVMQYAIDKRSPAALEQGYKITKDISDPGLKTQQFGRIAECFVKIGCILLKEQKSRADTEAFTSEIYPFERGLSIIKENVKKPRISLKIAGMIDILISYSSVSDNPDYIIPLAMFAVEIENPLERDAMMSRIISNLNYNVMYPDSTDPYEIMAFLLQRNEHSTSNPLMIVLIFRFLQLINDPYIELAGLCNLADTYIKLRDFDHAREILVDVYQSLPKIPDEYKKVLILADLTMLFSTIDQDNAKKCLEQGIERLNNVESEKNPMARKRIVLSIVQMNFVQPDSELITVALNVSSKISDPVEYVDSLIAIFSMTKNDRDQGKKILAGMSDAVERIPSPYEKASALLDIIPLALQNSDDDDTPVALLNKADALTRKINIPQIADTIRDKIAQLYNVIYHKHNNPKYLHNAIEVTKTIENDEMRLNRFMQMELKDKYEIPAQYEKINILLKKILEDSAHPSQITSLEKLIRSVADRGKEAILFCDIALMFRKEGAERISNRLLQNAINEARIIRPLSRRAFILCDIAMKTHTSGYEKTAQEVLDLAIDAATNIRQSSLRDEVFDELGLAIKLMQGM